ncbi:unnamed protein product [Parajaminaea phylloscopi]
MSALSSLSSHLRRPSAASHVRSFEEVSWSGQLGSQSAVNSLFGEALLDNIVLPGEISAVAVDPVQGYLAVGTRSGTVHLFGSPAIHLSWPLRPSQPVKFLLFKPGTPLLICADNKENLSIYDLSRPDPAAKVKARSQNARNPQSDPATGGANLCPSPDTPSRVAASTARNAITSLHVSPEHSHLFIGLRDGTVDTFDLDRLQASPFRIHNCWYEEEELLRKSGVPDAPPRRHVPLVVDISTSPQDAHLLLLAYEGGAALFDIKQSAVVATYQLRLLPGAPGAGGLSPEARWTERNSPATCVAWRPDGQVFAIGHEDGLISFWNPQDDTKPLLVRSLVELDLDRPTMDDLPDRPLREPIFKMMWAGFPAKGWFDGLALGSKGAEAPAATSPPPEDVTILTVLGGAVSGQDPPGVATIHFTATNTTSQSGVSNFWGAGAAKATSAPDASQKNRNRWRSQLQSVRESRLMSSAVVQDFVLLPRTSPHYGMAWDPVAIILLTDIPHGLPPLAPPAAHRGLTAAAFPPLPVPGSSRGTTHSANASIPEADTRSNPGPSPAPQADLNALRHFDLPFALSCTGAGAITKAQVVSVALPTYRKLTSIAPDGPRAPDSRLRMPLPLQGGLAAAARCDETSTEASSGDGRGHRILVTQHLDGTVRFADLTHPSVLKSRLANEGACDDPDIAARLASRLLDRGQPSPLEHLTISPRETLSRLSSSEGSSAAGLPHGLGHVRLSSVHFACEVLEVSIVLHGGSVLHYRWASPPVRRPEEATAGDQQGGYGQWNGIEDPSVRPNAAAHTHGSGSTSAQLLQAQDEVETGAALQRDMEAALHQLDPFSATHGTRPADKFATAEGQRSIPAPLSSPVTGTAPPRPRRDPKRGTNLSQSTRDDQIFGHGEASLTSSKDSQTQPHGLSTYTQRIPHSAVQPPASLWLEDFVSLEHVNDSLTSGFKAQTLVNVNRGEVTHAALSDVGFLAIACGSGVALVDLRGPEFLMRDGMGDDFSLAAPAADSKGKRTSRSARKLLEAESKAPVNALTWSICRLPGAQPSSHAALAPRLVIGRSNGLITVWTLLHSLDMWLPERTGATKSDDFESKDSGTVAQLRVLDSLGNAAAAIPAELQRSLRESSRGFDSDAALASDMPLLFGWAGSTLFINAGILGSRLFKAEVGESIQCAEVVERHMEKIVVVVSSNSVRLYSAPRLELIHRIQRHYHGNGDERTNSRNVVIDAGAAGMFLEVLSSLDVRLWTFFGQAARPPQPALLLWEPRSLPAPPGAGAVESITSWFSTKGTKSSSLDDIMGGPNRPTAPPQLPDVKTREEFVTAVTGQIVPPSALAGFFGGPEPQEGPSSRPAGRSAAQSQPRQTTGVLAQSREAQGTMWDNLDLARRRGEAMQGLENSLASLEKSANSWVKEAKSGLVKSAAKDKLSKFGL